MRHALVWPSSKLWSPPALGEMPANLAGRKLGSAEPAAGHSPPRRTSALCFGAPQSLIRLPTACSPMRRASAHMVRDRGPFRADREVGSHLVLGETGAATPAARHLRTTRASDEMERAQDRLPHSARTPSTPARKTSIAERIPSKPVVGHVAAHAPVRACVELHSCQFNPG